MRNSYESAIPAVLLAAATLAGCSRDEPQAPAAQSETRTAQALNRPATLTGCLRAGDASDTFVLTTTQTDQGVNPATYHLAGNGGVNLRDHVGRTVEVTGVIRDQQHIATTDAARPAGEEARGTSGTPTVQTGTQLAVRTLDVSAVRGAGGECPATGR